MSGSFCNYFVSDVLSEIRFPRPHLLNYLSRKDPYLTLTRKIPKNFLIESTMPAVRPKPASSTTASSTTFSPTITSFFASEQEEEDPAPTGLELQTVTDEYLCGGDPGMPEHRQAVHDRLAPGRRRQHHSLQQPRLDRQQEYDQQQQQQAFHRAPALEPRKAPSRGQPQFRSTRQDHPGQEWNSRQADSVRDQSYNTFWCQ